MKFRFFAIPTMLPDEAQEAVNRFCGAHRVVSIERCYELQVHDENTTWRLI